jgi:hypothetical protein
MAASAAVGCMMPPGPGERVTNAATELNTSARFGRMDLALEQTATGAKENFMQRRVQWGQEIRVMDINITGLRMPDADFAEVNVSVAWSRMSESTLRNTVIEQTWKNSDEDGGWKLYRERHVSGDLGLFGEAVKARPHTPPQDVHFPTRTLSSSRSP